MIVAAAIAAAALAPTPARLMVEGDEFRFALSRTAVKPGLVITQFRNAGEDPHDLVVRRRGRRRGTGFGEQRPGAVVEKDLRLTRGTYELLCTLPGHAKAGMRATLKVR